MAPRSQSASTRHPSEQRAGNDQGEISTSCSPAFTQPRPDNRHRPPSSRDSVGISRSQAVRASVSRPFPCVQGSAVKAA
jgi:hypothetical protein